MALDREDKLPKKPRKRLLGRFWARHDGATAIEFAILCLPFFMVVFASLETFIAFSAEQLLANANETMARKIRTGEIRATTTTSLQYRKAFCDEIAIMMPCSTTELATPNQLWLDVRSFAKYSDIPQSVPMKGTDLDTSSFKFTPGGKKTINIVRAYYRWNVLTDVIRPYLTNVTSADGTKQNYLMVATAVIENEDFP